MCRSKWDEFPDGAFPNPRILPPRFVVVLNQAEALYAPVTLGADAATGLRTIALPVPSNVSAVSGSATMAPCAPPVTPLPPEPFDVPAASVAVPLPDGSPSRQ